jgi:hypothetical protein
MRDSTPAAPMREVRATAKVLTLVTIGDSDLRLATLVDISVLQGELRTVRLRLPAGYELTGVTGSAGEASEPVDGQLAVTVNEPAARRHQLLVTLERPHDPGSFALDTGVVSMLDVVREQGEIAIEGVGTLEVATTEGPNVRRIDVRELDAALPGLAQAPLLSAFRYQQAPAGARLGLQVTRFGDASVLAAIAERAHVTTLVTSGGRMLTQVTLAVQNHAQRFMKVVLPTGASIVSVVIEDEPAKPVSGDDGVRVPLLRPGLHGRQHYTVEYVFLHGADASRRKGDIALALPRMDIPIGEIAWEVFAPEDYTFRHVGGNVVEDGALFRAMARAQKAEPQLAPVPSPPTKAGQTIVSRVASGPAGRVTGVVADTSGSALPGVSIAFAAQSGRMSRTVVSDNDGRFAFERMPPGPATLTASLAGFQRVVVSFEVAEAAVAISLSLPISSLAETVTVTGSTPPVDTARAAPSQDVVSLQQRVAGVLPIPIEVPRAGVSQFFHRPLVIDEETRILFRYKRK